MLRRIAIRNRAIKAIKSLFLFSESSKIILNFESLDHVEELIENLKVLATMNVKKMNINIIDLILTLLKAI